MNLRGRGCCAPAALALAVGGNLVAWGWATGSVRLLRAGASFLVIAVVLALLAWFFYWQGWGQ
jgi:hypothetical protein